jgi:hypothetical protein
LIDQSGTTFQPTIDGGAQPPPSLGEKFIRKMRRLREKR